jgi:uncharacterized protein HemX
MNPTPNPNPISAPTPVPMQSVHKPAGHLALTIVLIIVILLAFGFVGWKWFANQQEILALEAQNAAMQAELANVPLPSESLPAEEPEPAAIADDTNPNQAAVSRSVRNADALDSDMSLILNSSSEDDLRSIDEEF